VLRGEREVFLLEWAGWALASDSISWIFWIIGKMPMPRGIGILPMSLIHFFRSDDSRGGQSRGLTLARWRLTLSPFMRTLSTLSVFGLFLLASVRLVAAPSLLTDLDATQLADLRAGKQVVISTPVPGGPWPKLQVYTTVNAPVSAVESVFRDYKGASSYIPNLVSADVLEQPNPNTYIVKYTSSMPIVGKTSNTVKNVYSYDGSALVVSWNLIDSALAEISTGELRVEPDGKNTSVLRYTNYVKPKSSLAVLAKSAALSEVKQTVAAIKAEAERRK
jgi:hypothetical protein